MRRISVCPHTCNFDVALDDPCVFIQMRRCTGGHPPPPCTCVQGPPAPALMANARQLPKNLLSERRMTRTSSVDVHGCRVSGFGSVSVWFGLVWFGSVRFGSVRFFGSVLDLGWVWLGVVVCGCVWLGWVGLGWVGFGSVRFGSVRFSSVRFGSVRFGSVRFDSIRFGSVLDLDLGWVWLGVVRFGWVWFGLVRCGVPIDLHQIASRVANKTVASKVCGASVIRCSNVRCSYVAAHVSDPLPPPPTTHSTPPTPLRFHSTTQLLPLLPRSAETAAVFSGGSGGTKDD